MQLLKVFLDYACLLAKFGQSDSSLSCSVTDGRPFCFQLVLMITSFGTSLATANIPEIILAFMIMVLLATPQVEELSVA